MTGLKDLSVKNAQEAVDKFFLLGCNTIIITFGSQGAVHATKNDRNIKHTPTDVVKAIDTTVSKYVQLIKNVYYIYYTENYKKKKEVIN